MYIYQSCKTFTNAYMFHLFVVKYGIIDIQQASLQYLDNSRIQKFNCDKYWS